MGSFLPRPVLDIQSRRVGFDTAADPGEAANLIGSTVSGVIPPTRRSIPIGMFMGGGPGAMPYGEPPVVDDISSPVIQRNPGPEIGLSVDEFRQKHGLEALTAPEIAPTPSPAAGAYEAGDAAARARILSGAGAFHPSDSPWGGDVPMGDGSMGRSAMQTTVDDFAHADIDARQARAYANIDATARDPMRDQINAASEAAIYEDLIPKQRPLYDIGDPAAGGTPGAFHQSQDGTISNRLPAMRLGPERQALIGQAPEMRKQQQLSNLVSGLEKIQKDIQTNLELYQKTGGKQGLSPLDAKNAYDRAERIAGMAMEGISGGKDFGSFFKPTDPLQTTMALMMGQQAGK